ncbi:MAG: adenosylcobinamide-phosphate synthase CbiB [Alphaproteobacteria bacterium]|nr:adenosylcobinamide-phosphate synthase CbiB [Alphaproteobacteria bacterium]
MEFATDIWGIWRLPSLAGLDWAAGPGGAILLLIALGLDWLIGDPRWLPHPVRLMGAATAFLEACLNRAKRSAGERVIRGFLAVLAVAVLSALAGWALAAYVGALSYGWIAELALMSLLIAQRGMVSHSIRVVRALKQGGVAEGRKAVARIVGRETAGLDQHGVARAAIESCAESYSDGVIGPIFWYLLLGLPGLMAYKAVNTMDSMIGHKSERYAAFGMVAARLDDALNWLPARISGALIAVAAIFVPGARPIGALRVMLRDAGKHVSPNAGWPEAASAGALDLALLGPMRYAGGETKTAWLGDGRARATPGDMRRMLALFAVACFLAAGLVALIALLIQAI